jgi:hypothetical protein
MNTHQPIHRPFPLPRDLAEPRQASHVLARAVLAMARTVYDADRTAAVDIARQLWKGDAATLEIVQRAATSPATITTSGWASQLAATAVADVISNLGPASAGSELIRQALNLEWGRAASLRVPTIVASADDVGFVAEGVPIPIRQLALTGPVLEPRKFAVCFALTRQVVEHSTPNAERLVRAGRRSGVAGSAA